MHNYCLLTSVGKGLETVAILFNARKYTFFLKDSFCIIFHSKVESLVANHNVCLMHGLLYGRFDCKFGISFSWLRYGTEAITITV